MSLDELGLSYEYQGQTNSCGAYAISMATSLYYGACNSGADVADGIGWNSHGIGIPTWANYEQYIQNSMPDAVIEHSTNATMIDLKQAISQDKIVIVAISYESNSVILTTPVWNLGKLGIGHYMVAVGYDENQIYLLNSANKAARVDKWPNDAFNQVWQPGNLFIQPGSMWTISHP